MIEIRDLRVDTLRDELEQTFSSGKHYLNTRAADGRVIQFSRWVNMWTHEPFFPIDTVQLTDDGYVNETTTMTICNTLDEVVAYIKSIRL